VELKEVKLSDGYYVLDPEKAVEMVDENTICVAAILGSTLNGEFEDVKRLNDLLVAKNAETGYLSHSVSLFIGSEFTEVIIHTQSLIGDHTLLILQIHKINFKWSQPSIFIGQLMQSLHKSISLFCACAHMDKMIEA
jgi:glycerate-2-kinase